MDRNSTIGLLKFMDTMNISQSVEISRKGLNPRSRNKFVCVTITLTRGKKTEFLEHYCYEKDKNEKIFYADGNQVIGSDQGILKYIGSPNAVRDYFKNLARKKAEIGFSDF